MINKVILVGRFTKDPEARKGANDKSFCTFRLAVDNKKNSNSTNSATFVSCVGFGAVGDVILKYGRKGILAAVEGKLSQRTYTNSDNKKVSVHEVLIDTFQFLEKMTENKNEDNVENLEFKNEINEEDYPF